MKNKLPRFMVCLFVTIFLFGCSESSIAKKLPVRPEDIPERPVTYVPPVIEPIHLKNGINLFLMTDTQIPLVSIQGYFRAGEIDVSPDSSGLARLTGNLMRSGGADEILSDSVDRVLDFLGIQEGIGIGREYGSFSLSTPTEFLDTGLSILKKMFEHPRFEQKKFVLEKTKTLDAIKREWDQPATMASQYFAESVYGARSPWAHRRTLETIRNITHADVVNFYEEWITPWGMSVAVYGDFNVEKMTRFFSGMMENRVIKPVHDDLEPVKERKPEIIQVEKEITQTNIMLGHLGANRLSPDKFSLKVMNFILGEGDFYSRLMKEVRSDRGLAYSVWGGVGFDRDRGEFAISVQTKSASTFETIQLVKKIIREMTEKEPTVEELKTAKSSLKNQFVFFFSPPEKIVFEASRTNFLNYPKDYLVNYVRKIDAVTAEDVLEVAKKYMHPDRIHIVAVGNEVKYDTPLQTIGKVKHRKIQSP